MALAAVIVSLASICLSLVSVYFTAHDRYFNYRDSGFDRWLIGVGMKVGGPVPFRRP